LNLIKTVDKNIADLKEYEEAMSNVLSHKQVNKEKFKEEYIWVQDTLTELY